MDSSAVEHEKEKNLILRDDIVEECHHVDEIDDEKSSSYNLPSDKSFFLALTDQKYCPHDHQQEDYSSKDIDDQGQAIDNCSSQDNARDDKEEEELIMRNRKSLSNIDIDALLNDNIWHPLLSLRLFLLWVQRKLVSS